MGPRGRDPRPKEASNRPGWKGPSYIKKAKSATTTTTKTTQKEKSVTASDHDENPIPLELQQLLLNIFSNTFADVLKSDDYSACLQEVKQALFERDFEKAFGKEEYLQSYAARYSPSRALCYGQILVDIQRYFTSSSALREESVPIPRRKDEHRTEGPKLGLDFPSKVVCFGGGAAEVVAFGGLISYINSASQISSVKSEESLVEEALEKLKISDEIRSKQMKLLLVDTASWGSVIQNLSTALQTPPPLSKYASATAKANNSSLITKDILSTSFEKADALSLSKPEVSSMLDGETPILITLLFTLNELYTTSLPKTTAFLLHLTTGAKPGTLLLVVDSPGSYSETAVGKDLKKYPMQWLLDHTLLEKAKLGGGDERESKAAWEKLVGEDSEWFRLAEKLRYPIALEDMRYQIHLYRRI